MSSLEDVINPKVPLAHYQEMVKALYDWIKIAREQIDDLNERVKVLEDNKK